MNIKDIKSQLTIQDIENLMDYLGAEPILHNNILICKTICHGGHSHKLYYYDNTQLFKCYTDCDGESFDIGQLIIKVQAKEGKKTTLPQATIFLKKFFNLAENENKDFLEEDDEFEDWKIINRYIENTKSSNDNEQVIELKFYDDKILNFLPKPRIISWEKEGMTKESIRKHNVCYNPSSQAIVIPHYDIDGNLLGIRERTLIKENEIYGKYRPMYLNRQMYNHPNEFNLCNLNNSKENIKKIKKAIVFEGKR